MKKTFRSIQRKPRKTGKTWKNPEKKLNGRLNSEAFSQLVGLILELSSLKLGDKLISHMYQ